MKKNTSIVFGLIALIVMTGGIYPFINSSKVYASTDSNKDTLMLKKQMEEKVMKEKKMTKEKAMMQKKLMAEKERKMKANTPKTNRMMKKDETSMVNKGDTMMKAGSYETYTPEKVSMASTTHDVVLFFRASWCPTCRAVDSDIKSNLSKIPSSLTILDVNYDDSTLLKQKYGVTYQHTFVQVDKDGNLIKKWSGSSTLALIVSEIQK